ncbi:MAG: hypothetical protein APF83_12190 [Lutibacter sp. BRH_c52]|nr:MAG: hypothetical protein APF83_12190 [Lutibacter sp. BRH_c52]
MKNHILFVSTLCSKRVFEYIRRNSTDKSGQAIQKFHQLLVNGLAEQKNNVIETSTSIPVTPKINSKKIFRFKAEKINNIHFKYIPIINLPIIKNLNILIYSFIKVLSWNLFNGKKNNFLICDVLALSNCIGAFCASKIRGLKIIGIVTDMPGLGVSSFTFLESLKSRIIHYYLLNFDGYILITAQTNKIINPKNRPSIVIEGFVDKTMETHENTLENKEDERILLYSGGVFERYGIKNLMKGFMLLKDTSIRLHIYGSGAMAKEMPKYMELDSRIKYMGVVPVHILVERQVKATLLINPRPTVEEFTKYSFPSKNMEYMVSGTPVVTTLLPGMPKEYLPYVYLFKDESIEGIYEVLLKLLNIPKIELHSFGIRAKIFVLENKNHLIQGERISEFIKNIK